MPGHMGQPKHSTAALGTALPSIYAKHGHAGAQHCMSQKQIDLSASLGSIQRADDASLSRSSLERAGGRGGKHLALHDSLGSMTLADPAEARNLGALYADFLGGGGRAAGTEESRGPRPLLPASKGAARQSSVGSQSPQEMAGELAQAFREHPDANPFQLMMDARSAAPAGNGLGPGFPRFPHASAAKLLEENELSASKFSGLATQHKVQLVDKATRSPNEQYLEMRMSQASQLSGNGADPISINLNININNYNTAEKAFDARMKGGGPGARGSRLRVSRRRHLEPLRVAEPKDLSRSFKAPAKVFSHEPPASLAAVNERRSNLGEQALQLQEVAKFCNVQMDNQIERERVKATLAVLTAKLEEKGLTLRDVVDAHYKELDRRDGKETTEGGPMATLSGARPGAGESGASRNDAPLRRGQSKLTSANHSRFASLDYAGIIECSSDLRPLIAHQKRFKAEKKRLYGEGKKEQQDQLDLPFITQGRQETAQAFDAYEATVDAFIANLQTLVKFSKSKIGDSILSSANLSQLALVEEPEMYVSSSGESKYSEQDRHYADHLLQH